jgi:VWFA-related protein
MCVRFGASTGTILRIAVNNLAVLLALAVQCTAAPPGSTEIKPFIECDRVELVRAVPELAGIQFEPGEDRLDGLLQAVGERLRGMFAKLVATSAAEEIHEMRFEDTMVETSRRENFRYVVRPLAGGVRELFEELRTEPNTGLPVEAAPTSDFLVMGHFFRLLRYLLPEQREQSRFRYLGRWTTPEQEYFVLAFAQRSEGTQLRSHILLGGGRTAPLQGIVWIDSTTNRIVRLRLDLLGRIEDFAFKTLTTDISLASINFPSVGAEYWLPARVTVHAQYAGGEVHTVHRYSDYRLYGVAEKEKHAGVSAAMTASAEDPWELLDRGISLVRESKPGEAITVFHEALRLNPEMAFGHYHLATALRATGDLAGAETELREAMKRIPNSGPVHNSLGVVLFKRGDIAGAVAEFRTSTQLQPTDATVHFNLAQALEKLGDRKAALEEYRTASTLAPGNAVLKERYEQLERASNAPTAPAADTTIKVNVRQVLVPVIVTDPDGHHVTGLKQPDFRVFEDSVEQKISAFSVEDAATPSVAAVPANTGAQVPAGAETAPKRLPIRRTYLICIDSIHSAFASLVHVREALSKLFQEEHAGDSQYIVVAVGTSTQMVQRPTTDPADVLRAVEAKDFAKLFGDSRRGFMQPDLREFQRELDEARNACDHGEPECAPMKRRLPSEASQIATQERMATLGFLRQFRALVEELARGTERRHIILLSDGFQLVPGKEAYELLAAYFPEIPFIALRSLDRMQDLEPILRLAANSNIPIYTIDSRGLYTSTFFAASTSASVARMMPQVLKVTDQNASAAGDSLNEIAAVTGGTAFHNSNDILKGLERAFADGRQYYVLAYVPSGLTSDGKFHSISVQVRDSKMMVSAKRGYWATAN